MCWALGRQWDAEFDLEECGHDLVSPSLSPELACPPHSHYELCGSSCPSSCAEPALPDSCPTPCQEGCQCDPGFMLSGTDCVPPTQCGCSLEGRYYLPGEIFWAGERCERLCYCEASTGMVRCSPYSCGPGQRCGVLRGVFGCHALSPGTCQVAGHAHIIAFNGRPVALPSTCASVLAESCGAPGLLPFFKVELQKENRSHSPLMLISAVSIRVNGTLVQLQRDSPGMAQVSRAPGWHVESSRSPPPGQTPGPLPKVAWLQLLQL